MSGEQDQAKAIAFAALNKVTHDRLHDLKARQLGVVDHHVARLHGAGDIQHQHQVASGGRHLHRIPDPLRPAGGQHQQQPDGRAHQQGQQAVAVQARGVAVQLAHLPVEGDVQRRVLARSPRHEPVDQQRDRECCKGPRPRKFKHALASL